MINSDKLPYDSCRKCVCQISGQLKKFKFKSHSFETSRDLTIRRPSPPLDKLAMQYLTTMEFVVYSNVVNEMLCANGWIIYILIPWYEPNYKYIEIHI